MKTSTHNKILETAKELFYQKGYNLTGINEIIAKAGIAKASLYSNFSSKEAICIAYLQEMGRELTENMTTFLQAKPQGRERLLGIFDFLEQVAVNDSFNGCWCVNMLAEIPPDNKQIRAEVLRQKKATYYFFKGLVQENLAVKEKEEIKSVTRKIYLLYEGALTECGVQNSAWPVKEAKEMMELFIK